MQRVLVIEDDERVSEELRLLFEAECFEVETARGAGAARLALRRSFDVAILDLGLPDGDGLELCRELRRGDQVLPVLMLTARDAPEARVRGLECGADDYLTKPCHLPELLARVRALLRRAKIGTSGSICRIGDLWLDRRKREAGRAGRVLKLRRREFDLLAFLMNYPDRPWTREQLLDRVWEQDTDVTLRTIDIHVRRIRQQIEDRASTPRFLLTEFGVGYRMRGEMP